MQRLKRHVKRFIVEQFNQGETEGLRCPWSECPYTVHWQVSHSSNEYVEYVWF